MGEGENTGSTIQVHVRCFGSLAARVGENCLVWVCAPATVDDVIAALHAEKPRLSLLLLNGRQVRSTVSVHHGDQLMLIPPVQGG